MKMIKKAKKGFTLIELVVVIAVIAILSGVSVVAYVGITNNAKKSAAQTAATQIVTTIRAGALASSHGYDEEKEIPKKTVGEGASAEQVEMPYHVELDGKVLKITKDASDSRSDKAIIEDMLSELGEPDLAAEVILIKPIEEGTNVVGTKIGVLIQGKEKLSTADADYVFAEF